MPAPALACQIRITENRYRITETIMSNLGQRRYDRQGCIHMAYKLATLDSLWGLLMPNVQEALVQLLRLHSVNPVLCAGDEARGTLIGNSSEHTHSAPEYDHTRT